MIKWSIYPVANAHHHAMISYPFPRLNTDLISISKICPGHYNDGLILGHIPLDMQILIALLWTSTMSLLPDT